MKLYVSFNAITLNSTLVITKGYRVGVINDRRTKHFCSITVLCVSFTRQILKTLVIRLRVIEGPNVHD